MPMKRNAWSAAVGLSLLALAIPAAAQAQAQAAPPQVYTGAFGAGFALTGGNTDTKSFNLTFELTRDPKTKNVFKANALYLRANAAGQTNADRLLLGVRDEYSFSKRVFVYGAFPYMRDPFKNISYLLNPQGGIGYKLIATDRTTLSTTGGAGIVWEKNPGVSVQTSGTINFGQGFSYKLSEMASINQGFTALWKTSDFADALYHTSIALVASITKKAQLKVEFIDDYKNVTPSPIIKKNDTAFITSFIYKF
jgi:putative salt-induced outer membrane protein YdiY